MSDFLKGAVCFALLTVGSLFALKMFAKPRPEISLQSAPSRSKVWHEAVQQALDFGDYNLLGAIFDSEVPLARDIARNTFFHLPASNETLALLIRAYQENFPATKLIAIHNIFRMAESQKMEIPTQIRPMASRFESNPDFYIDVWNGWLETNQSELIKRVKSSTPHSDFITFSHLSRKTSLDTLNAELLKKERVLLGNPKQAYAPMGFSVEEPFGYWAIFNTDLGIKAVLYRYANDETGWIVKVLDIPEPNSFRDR